MKRSERTCAIMQILTDNPNKDFSMGSFAAMFGCAKSSISEDIKLVRDAMDEVGLGYVETTSGSKVGVRFVPYLSDERVAAIMERVKTMFEEPDRMLGSGFLYTSDIMYDPVIVEGLAGIFAKRFAAIDADIVVTVETKGIGVALFTARLLNLPLAIIMRESKISEGSTVSINFFSGSTDRLQKMSLAKKAIDPGARAIIIDDFMRGGGSIKGMKDMLREFDATCVATGVVIAAEGGRYSRAQDVFPLLLMHEEASGVSFSVNPELLK